MNQNQQTSITRFLGQNPDTGKSFSPEMVEIKVSAGKRFQKLGFPTKRNEEWKYTDVSRIVENDFVPAGNKLRLTKKDIAPFIQGLEDKLLLVFENGYLNTGLSLLQNVKSGLLVGEISQYSSHEKVKKHLGKIATDTEESFLALNTALFNQGAFVYADGSGKSVTDVHLVYINDARENPTVVHPRNLFIAGKSASLRIYEYYYSLDSVNPSFCNPVTEICVEENATLEICKYESESVRDFHIDYTGIVQEKNSNLLINTITTGGRIVRNNLRIELGGVNSSAYLNGLYVISGESHVDNHSVVVHSSPGCYSNELYKGVLDDKSHGVFNGRILVRKDAQKTNAFQSNKSMLLSDDAVTNSKPQLEIYADDVKCSHGATTGQLDPEAMFYLRSRGIGEKAARELLTTAFAGEILDKLTIENVREIIREDIINKLSKGSQ